MKSTNRAEGDWLVRAVHEAREAEEERESSAGQPHLGCHVPPGDAHARCKQEHHAVRRKIGQGPRGKVRARQRLWAFPTRERGQLAHRVDALPERRCHTTVERLDERHDQQRPVGQALAQIVCVADAAHVVCGAVVLDAQGQPADKRAAPQDCKHAEACDVGQRAAVQLVSTSVLHRDAARDVVAHAERLPLAVDHQRVVCLKLRHRVEPVQISACGSNGSARCALWGRVRWCCKQADVACAVVDDCLRAVEVGVVAADPHINADAARLLGRAQRKHQPVLRVVERREQLFLSWVACLLAFGRWCA